MRLLSAFFVLFQIVLAGWASACSLAEPRGAVVLRVDGQIRACNVGLEVLFDMPMLEALPKHTVRTENPWEEGVSTYEGVLLRDLLDHVQANGAVLKIAALNDYSAEITVADVQSINVILAYRRNGEYMPVRDRGPLFVIFPFSDQPSLAAEERYGQSVWQVSAITVK